MLYVQQYLKTHTLEQLAEELAIKVTWHPTKPLVILNYNQLDSPKLHPVVRECRGLVLEAGTNALVARSFPRFFNWGEVADELKLFDFSNCYAHTKEDGSLVLIYHYQDQWHINTRGSFALDPMQFQDFTWQEGVERALGCPIAALQLDPTLTYVWELCTPWNKVVRRYPEPKLFFLTAFEGEAELAVWECDEIATMLKLSRPARFDFHSIEEVQAYLQQQAKDDPTYEGVVLRDCNNQRWKVKSPTYLALHHMCDNGNLFNPKHLLPFVLTGDTAELLTYFPEAKDAVAAVEAKVTAAYAQLELIWGQSYLIPDQKEFALAIVGKTPFTGILFTMRKRYGFTQTRMHLRNLWEQSAEQIIKVL